MPSSKNFLFGGGAGSYILTALISWFITLISFGLAYPWALCMFHKWRTEHTIINGKRLKFNGTGFSLIFLWIKWWFLSLITFGFYILWVIPSLNKWVVEHTDYADLN